MKSMIGFAPFLLTLFLLLAAYGGGQKILEEEFRIETKPRSVPAQPEGPKTARRPQLNGVLFVLTDPPETVVLVKRGKKVIKQGKSKAGQFRTELRPGLYEIEVSADKHSAFTGRANVRLVGTEPVRAELTPQTGTIIIGMGAVDFDAEILLDGRKPEKLRIHQAENQVEINDVPAGRHTLRISHLSIAEWERKEVPVEGGAAIYVTPRFEPAAAELSVETEPGVRVYVKGEYIGDTTEDGKLNRSNIPLGSHEVKLAKDGYEEYKQICRFEFRRPVSIARKLVPLPTSSEFNDDFDVFNPNKWSVPSSGWIYESGRFHLSNAPLGSPKGIVYRDFTMNFYLKLDNAGGAAWSVRAKDANNHYLFYLSGPDGLFPGRFVTYIVRDNKFDPNDFYISTPVITQIVAQGQYTVTIQARGNRIIHTIVPASTGRVENLGFFEDPKNTFPYGGVGFRTIGPEKFWIDEIVITPH